MTATEMKNRFGHMLDEVAQGRAVVVTKHDAPRAVLGRVAAREADLQDMLLGYEITLVQEGNRLYGGGLKVSENGVLLPRARRTPIDVAGRIENGQVVLNFTETGASRTSRGTIRWRVAPGDDDVEGRFSSDAAGTSGASSGRRLR